LNTLDNVLLKVGRFRRSQESDQNITIRAEAGAPLEWEALKMTLSRKLFNETVEIRS
jgi:hypothetical protein